MKNTRDQIEQDIEKFRFELAEELGVIEQTDKGKRGRGVIERYRPPVHKHIRKEK